MRSSALRAEGEGVEPSRLIARPISNRVPSPIGLPFRRLPSIHRRHQPLSFEMTNDQMKEAPAGGIEPPIVALTGRRLTVRPHRSQEYAVGMAGFEPAISCFRSTKVASRK
jgi:hypothetical protein